MVFPTTTQSIETLRRNFSLPKAYWPNKDFFCVLFRTHRAHSPLSGEVSIRTARIDQALPLVKASGIFTDLGSAAGSPLQTKISCRQPLSETSTTAIHCGF